MKYIPRNEVFDSPWKTVADGIVESCKDRRDAVYIAAKMQQCGMNPRILCSGQEVCQSPVWKSADRLLRGEEMSVEELANLCAFHPRIAVESKAILRLPVSSQRKFASRRDVGSKMILRYGEDLPTELYDIASVKEPWYALKYALDKLSSEAREAAVKKCPSFARKIGAT